MYYETVIVSLISIHHHTFLEFFSCDENFKIYSQQLADI